MTETNGFTQRKTWLLALIAVAALAAAILSFQKVMAPTRGRVIGVDAGPGKAASLNAPR